jgi:hypothetical protein
MQLGGRSEKRMMSVKATVMAGLLGFAGHVAAGAEGAGSQEASMKVIADAWARRQAVVKTVRVAWEHEQTAVGLKEELAGPQARRAGATGIPHAPSVLKIDRVSSLSLDGNKFAYSFDSPNANEANTPGSRIKIPSHYKTVLTETEYENYLENDPDPLQPNRVTAVVTINKADGCDESQMPDVRPLMLAFRPLTASLSFIDLSKYRISPVRGTVGNASCLILEPQADASSQRPKKSYWVDPARDYIIVRAVNSVEGQGALQTDIAYGRDAVIGWVPSSWSFVDVDRNGHLIKSFRAGVETCTLNQPIPAGDFIVPRPDGVLIHDLRKGGDDRRRVGERALKDVTQVSNRFWWVLIGNMCVVALVVIALVVRHVRRGGHA